MAVANGGIARSRNEEVTPLLREQRGRHDAAIIESSTRANGGDRDEEHLLDVDRANQHVGKTRGALIMLSLLGLIFLQGKSTKSRDIGYGRGLEMLVINIADFMCSFQLLRDHYRAI